MKSLLKNRQAALAVWALLVCFLPTAWADVVPVANASFETLPPGGLVNTAGCGNPGCFYSVGAIPGWSSSGTSGQFQPGYNAHFETLSLGPTHAWIASGTISQTVSPVVELGRTYTLQIDLGNRKDMAFGAVAHLVINGNTYMATGITPDEGGWSTYAVTYAALPADVGQAITIQLSNTSGQGNFDNVQLFSVPESADLMLLACVSAAVLFRAMRRHAGVTG